jgi:ubiquinone/menaquinone biosynthesis C-methylase UbiE
LRSHDAYTSIAPHYDMLMSEVPYRTWVDYVEELFQAYGCSPRRVLDLATGTGTVALELARRGYQVTGVDRASAMLAVARKKSRDMGLRVRWIEQDLVHLDLSPSHFDASVCLYDSLNYILSARKLQRAFKRIAPALKPGALFIFDLNTVSALERNLFTQEGSMPGGLRYTWRSRYNRKTRIARIDMDFRLGEQHFREVHRERAYTSREIEAMLRRAGMPLVDRFAGCTRLPPARHTDRIYYLARRA